MTMLSLKGATLKMRHAKICIISIDFYSKIDFRYLTGCRGDLRPNIVCRYFVRNLERVQQKQN